MNKPLISICLALIITFAAQLKAAEPETDVNQAVYYRIVEPFTINFLNQSQKKIRYLQVKVALMAHDAAIIDSAKLNLPMIQDALRTLFTDQTYQTVSTVAGRKQIQQQAVTLIRSLLKEETGSDALEQVYFTSFILQ